MVPQNLDAEADAPQVATAPDVLPINVTELLKDRKRLTNMAQDKCITPRMKTMLVQKGYLVSFNVVHDDLFVPVFVSF